MKNIRRMLAELVRQLEVEAKDKPFLTKALCLATAAFLVFFLARTLKSRKQGWEY